MIVVVVVAVEFIISTEYECMYVVEVLPYTNLDSSAARTTLASRFCASTCLIFPPNSCFSAAAALATGMNELRCRTAQLWQHLLGLK